MTQEAVYTPTYTPPGVQCLVCKGSLEIRLAHGRKSKKAFLMLVCPTDGRHFRGFINDQAYVKSVLERLEDSHESGDLREDLNA